MSVESFLVSVVRLSPKNSNFQKIQNTESLFLNEKFLTGKISKNSEISFDYYQAIKKVNRLMLLPNGASVSHYRSLSVLQMQLLYPYFNLIHHWKLAGSPTEVALPGQISPYLELS